MRKPFYKILYVQVLFAIAVGILLGHFWPQTGVDMKPLGDAFIKLIKMIIGPIIFCTVVSGIAGMRDMKKVGRVGGKALLYFEIVSTFALLIGLIATHAQAGRRLQHRSGHAGHQVDRAVRVEGARPEHGRLLHAHHPGHDLQRVRQRRHPADPAGLAVVRFGAGTWASARIVHDLVDQVSKVFFHIVHVITKVAPIGAFGAMAFTIGKYGLGSLVPLLKLIGTFYFTAIVFVLVVLGTVARLTASRSSASSRTSRKNC
jgi:aerobic C4-dicarboxylate transport protein